jgi:charged multivesicular body protein 5
MKRVFGKKKVEVAAPAPTLDQASTGVGTRISAMDGKIDDLDKELRGYKEKIKKTSNPAAKKQLQKRALDILKRKRMYENQRDAASAQQFNIDQTNFSLESAKASIDTVAAMKAANVQLKKTLRQDLDLNDVDDLADDMAELMDDFNDINEYVMEHLR